MKISWCRYSLIINFVANTIFVCLDVSHFHSSFKPHSFICHIKSQWATQKFPYNKIWKLVYIAIFGCCTCVLQNVKSLHIVKQVRIVCNAMYCTDANSIIWHLELAINVNHFVITLWKHWMTKGWVKYK